MIWLEAILLTAVLISAVTDLLERRIFNLLTLPVTAIGVLSPLVSGDRWWSGLAGMIALAGPYFVLYAVNSGLMGAGDVKLLMAVGALVGWHTESLEIGIGSVVLGGILSLLALILSARLGDVLHIFRLSGFAPQKSLKAPFGLAIAIATVAVVAVRDLR